MKQKNIYFSVVALVLAFGFISFAAVAKNGNAQSEKSAKNSDSKIKKEKTVNVKNYEKADEAKGITNSEMYRVRTEEVSQELEKAANEEKTRGNKEAGEKIDIIVEEQERVQTQTAKAIQKVEERGKLKTLLIGTDYKNLGQLRSNLVQNRNQIRILTRTMETAQTEEGKALIQEQLQTLMQERERIKAVISENESEFSILGWVSRFLSGYEEKPTDNQEEEDLKEEVEKALTGATAAEAVQTTVQ